MRPVPRQPAPSTRLGFTLVEVIATVVIVGAIGVFIAGAVRATADAYAAAAQRAELVNSASAALERAVTGLRDIPLRASVTPAEPAIETITTSSITATAADSAYGLALSGTNLQLTVAGVTTTLVRHVSDFQVRAFDQGNIALADTLSGNTCDPVRRIELTLTLSRNGVSETLRTRVFLRCMIAGAST